MLNYDIIFVDDKSTDGSLESAKKILCDLKNIVIIENKKNIGLSKSCNKALKACKTKYFIRVDSDDFIKDKTIHFFEKTIKKNLDFIYCNRIEFNKKQNKKINIKNNNLFQMISCGVALKTNLVNKIGGYKDILWEEYDLYIRYLKNNKKILRINEYLYLYRKHKKSMSSNKKWIKNAWKQLNKKYGEENIRKFTNLKEVN